MDNRATTETDRKEKPKETSALSYDNWVVVAEHFPPASKTFSTFCRISSDIYAAFQMQRLAGLLSKRIAEAVAQPDAHKTKKLLLSIHKILTLTPSLMATKINISSQQFKDDEAFHFEFIFQLINASCHDENPEWVIPILKFLHFNNAKFTGVNVNHLSILHLAVMSCSAFIVDFLYDHHLVDTNKPDNFILNILQQQFGANILNRQSRAPRVLNRLCIEHQYLFVHIRELLSEREFATFFHQLTGEFLIVRHSYVELRYRLSQFYLYQLTVMTAPELFNGLVKNCGEILEKDIPKILSNTHGLADKSRVFEILKLILLADYTAKDKKTYSTIGVEIFQHYLTNRISLSSDEAHAFLMLSVTFLCIAGKDAMHSQCFLQALSILLGVEYSENIKLDDFVAQHTEALLDGLQDLVRFYGKFVGIELDSFDSHPFVVLQNYARKVLVERRMIDEVKVSHSL